MIGSGKKQAGFSLLELMIAMFIIIILLSIIYPTYQNTVRNAKETVLKDNLRQMRRLIDQYAADKGKLPQSLDDLKTSGYMRETPVDPITNEDRWDEIKGDDPNSTEGEQGLKDVKSLAEGQDSNGKDFKEY